MRKLIGPHLAGSWISNLDILRKWQPPLALVLSPAADQVRQLRDACPNTIVVGRHYHDDNHYASNIQARPREFAQEIHNEIVNHPATPLLDYWQTNNETNQDWQGIQQLNVYTQEWMHLADQSQAYKCAILAFSVGNPDLPHKPGDPAGFDGRMLYWQQVLPSLNYAQQRDHILWMHAYDFPHMFRDPDWYIYRFERQVVANLRALGITRLKYGYGEQGIDRLVTGTGEKGGYKSVPTTDENFVNQELQWERDLQGQDLLLGGCIYTFGDSGGWGTYDIASTNVAAMIADHYVVHAGNYKAAVAAGHSSPEMGPNQVTEKQFIPTVSNPGNPVEPTLPPPYPADWDPRLTERGVKIERVLPGAPGTLRWTVTKGRWLDEQESQGRHHFYADVYADGKPVIGAILCARWPGDGYATFPMEDKPGVEPGANFPLSKSRNEFSFQVNEPKHPSDVVTGVGMGAMTPGGYNTGIHTSTYIEWTLTRTPPTPTQPAPVPAVVPALAHPIQDPAKRIISQRFGENPQDYARFGMAGHTGLDFAVPEGTVVVAVDDGQVMEVLEDTEGYGKYIKLKHAWGESLYAHLSFQNLREGRVMKGGIIGRSGNTGNSTGPHLHFGMRVNPYKRGRPYDGYVDPAPYIVNVTPQPQPTPTDKNILALIKEAAQEFGVEWQLLASLAWAESSFNRTAVSSQGAQGLLQLMPSTFAEWAVKVGASDPFNARDNLRTGAAYLAWLIKQFNGDVRDALLAYNIGIGNVLNHVTGSPATYEYIAKVIHGRDLLKAVQA